MLLLLLLLLIFLLLLLLVLHSLPPSDIVGWQEGHPAYKNSHQQSLKFVLLETLVVVVVVVVVVLRGQCRRAFQRRQLPVASDISCPLDTTLLCKDPTTPHHTSSLHTLANKTRILLQLLFTACRSAAKEKKRQYHLQSEDINTYFCCIFMQQNQRF